MEPYVWDSVKGKILASMFTLANTWDLAAHLGNHQLVRFINDQHSIQHELLQRPKPSSEPIFEDLVQGLDEISSLVKKLRPGSESDDDQQSNIDQRCTRCDRRVMTVGQPLSLVSARCKCSLLVWQADIHVGHLLFCCNAGLYKSLKLPKVVSCEAE